MHGPVRFLLVDDTPANLVGLAALLRRLEISCDHRPYARALLAAFPGAATGLPASPHAGTAAAYPDSRDLADPPHDAIEVIIEQLTNREVQVLACLDQHLTSKEIAAELSISPLTVKRHISNLSGKLGVSSRRLAVRRARVLGLLSGSALR